MSDYLQVFQFDGELSLTLDAGDDKVLAVGQKMEEANPDAYMNGYNWEAFWSYYLQKKDPDILSGMKTDPEAGMYAAYWPLSPENEARAGRFEELIRSLVEDGEELCRILREEGGAIEWD